MFFAVDDIDAAADRVRELGGEIEDMDMDGEEESVAKFGRFKLCNDDQGSRFGLHQPPRLTKRREGAGRFEVPLRPANRLRYWAAGLTPRWPRSLRLTPSRLEGTYAVRRARASGHPASSENTYERLRGGSAKTGIASARTDLRRRRRAIERLCDLAWAVTRACDQGVAQAAR